MNDDIDLLVLGGGSGGIACARRAARYGAKVAVVESGLLGGTCVNVGCVPKKLMWHAAQLAHAAADAEGYGFDRLEPRLNWTGLVTRREAYLRRLNGIYQHNLESDDVAIIAGQGRFVDAHTVAVAGRQLRAQRILIATGSRPLWPALPGTELGTDSNGFFALTRQPRRVTLVGSGYIAVELAGMMRALGSQVSLLLRRDSVLNHFDPMLGEILCDEMHAAGIELHFRSQVQSVRREGSELFITTDTAGELASEVLIWAIGREPNTTGLELSAAGLDLGAKGEIVVDKFQVTSQPHIFAVGDVSGAPELTPVAIAAGRRLADRIFGGQDERRLDYGLIPSVVFSHPPIGTVGLSEPQARARYGEQVRVYESRFKSLYTSLLEEKVQSAVKLVVEGPQERIVGLHTIGPGSDEMLQGFAVALAMGATKRDFDDTIAIHPTASEELVTLN